MESRYGGKSRILVQEFFLVPAFHDKDQIRPLKDIQVDLTCSVSTHVNAMFQSYFLRRFMRRMIN